MRSASLLCSLLFAVVAAGCAHKPPAPEPAAMQSTAPAVAVAPPPAAPPEQSCSADDDCSDKSLCIRGHCVAITPDVELSECTQVRVHFDFDSSLLRGEDKPRLVRVARCLRADQKLHVTVEGNADDRGTEEYNLQLGSKRANSVERYLEALGVSHAQLKTVSYGFERPLCTEENESCWAENRRAGMKGELAAH